MRDLTYLEAVREALWQEMERDERVFIIGMESVARSEGLIDLSEYFLIVLRRADTHD